MIMSHWKKRKKKMEVPQMEKINKIKCGVCGKEFYPVKEKRYTSMENRTEGGITNALSGRNEKPEIYDTFDCPVCGCQIIVNTRKRRIEREDRY